MGGCERVIEVLFPGLRVGSELAPGYVLGGVSAAAGLELSIRATDRTFVVWVRRPDPGERCYRRTARFGIGYSGTRLGPSDLQVIDNVVALIMRGEESLAQSDYERLLAAATPSGAVSDCGLSLEWLAVEAGLKPAVRLLAAEDLVAGIMARAEEVGLHGVALPASEYIAGFGTGLGAGRDTLLFLARDPAAASVACAAESALMAVEHQRGDGSPDWLERLRRHTRELGRALGYPTCCVEFFLAHRDVSNAARQLLALRRTTTPPSHLLNNFDFGRSLISHFVCRYDCEPSLAYSGALLTELERRDPSRAEAQVEAWRTPIVLRHGSETLRVEFV